MKTGKLSPNIGDINPFNTIDLYTGLYMNVPVHCRPVYTGLTVTVTVVVITSYLVLRVIHYYYFIIIIQGIHIAPYLN